MRTVPQHEVRLLRLQWQRVSNCGSRPIAMGG